MEHKINRLTIIVITLAILFLISFTTVTLIQNYQLPGVPGERVALIKIFGPIVVDGGASSLIDLQKAKSETILKHIERIKEDTTIKAVIFEINSPGGTVVASQEIADAVKSLNKTNVAVIREVGASGAYWVASASEHIIASPMSITGSIGVLSSYLQFSELFENYGVEYERIVAGKYKDMGSPFKEPTKKEKELLQGKVDLVHDFFIKEISQNRNMSEDKVKKIATGEFYLGQEALELGLVDELGNMETAKEYMKQQLNTTEINIVEFKRKERLFDLFSRLSAYNIGKGIASELKNTEIASSPKLSV